MLNDLRYAARLLIRAPGFTAIAVAALALGIGANTAIFSVVNSLLLRPLPYRDPQRLAVVWEHNLPRDRKDNVVSPGNYLHWREMNRVFEDMAALGTFRTTLSGRGEAEELSVQYVTSGLPALLGVPPQRGRWFTTADEAPNVNVALISDRLWRRRFGADPRIVNDRIVLDGVPHTVVGVMPRAYSIFAAGLTGVDTGVDLWVPIGFSAAARTPRGRWLTVIARLKDGVTMAQAQSDMRRVHADLTRMFPDFNTGWTARVVPLKEQLTGDLRAALLVMLGAVGCVLLIACANVGNLLLARATARQRELAVRAALGADRRRLIRQMFAESLLLSGIGGVAGLAIGWWAVLWLRNAVAQRVPISRLDQVTIDGRVLAFTALAAVASAVAFGVLPALSAAGSRLVDALKEGGRAGSGGRSARIRNTFIVAEMALALVLLVGAGLLVRSFVQIMHVDPGFDASHTVTVKVSIPRATYNSDDKVRGFFDRLFERLDGLPGVRAAGGVSYLPMNGLGAATGLYIIGKPRPPAGQEAVTDVRVVTHNYFQAMGIPLLRGRLFDATDSGPGVKRLVINQALARKYFPGEDAIGKQLSIMWNDLGPDEIIGIVGDVRHQSLEDEVRPVIYWPPTRFSYPFMTVAVRTAADPTAIVTGIVDRLHQLDANVAAADIRTMEEVVDLSVAQRRVTMMLLAVFAGLALTLAAVGIYGVIGYTVTQRTQEIGIRMALGAPRASVLVMVLRQAMTLTLVGIVIGGSAAALLTRLMRKLLFGVTPSDPITFAVVAALLAAIAALAATVPGLRATRVDPLTALRSE
jgi:putative ABC transport system permease protein